MRKLAAKIGINKGDRPRSQKKERTGNSSAAAGKTFAPAKKGVNETSNGKPHGKQKMHNITGKSLIRDTCIAVSIAFAVSAFIGPTIVHETSMQPTIDPRDYIIMNKQSYRFGKVKRGDIIIFKSGIKDNDNKHTKLLIKRVIGVSGDIITIAHGKVYLNGEVLSEDYIAEDMTQGDITNLKIGPDEVFVMGDHRSVSMDSRELGCIKEEAIRGKAIFRLMPFGRFGAIK